MKCKTLEVWKKSARLSANIYKYFAESNDFGVKDQITRAGLSVPSNIAEGMEKSSIKENVRFIEIARASLAELMTQIYIGIDIKYIDSQMGKSWIEEAEELLKMLIGLQRTIKAKQG